MMRVITSASTSDSLALVYHNAPTAIAAAVACAVLLQVAQHLADMHRRWSAYATNNIELHDELAALRHGLQVC